MKHLWALLFVITIGYLDIVVSREDFFVLFALYSLAFGLFYFLYQETEDHHNILYFVGIGIAARVISLVGLPNLSDDFYRFYWDGYLMTEYINPYLPLPTEFVTSAESSEFLKNEIYPHLNSPEYYSIYPPFSQIIYALGVKLAGENLVIFNGVIGGLILLAECGTIYVGLKLLPLMGFSQKNILLYALNPLVIIEACGNLHFEAILVFFFFMAVWTQHRKRWWRFGIFFVLSILTKFFTAIFYPLYAKRLGWKRFFWIGLGITIGIILGFAPFSSPALLENITSSMDLYVRKFEFNASIYYLLREVGYLLRGYNLIGIIGPLLAIIFFIVLGIFYGLQYINDRGILLRSMFIFTIYLLLSPVVHPWYLILLISLSIFTKYRYPLVWTYVVFLSYSAYSTPGYKENMALLFTEYAILFLAILYDIGYLKPLTDRFNKTKDHAQN